MHLTTQETLVENLTIGMYVSRLDVPWVQTPFPIQGFCITKEEELELLSHHCNKVFVDIKLSKIKNIEAKLSLSASAPKINKDEIKLDANTIRLMKEKARFKPRVENYKMTGKLKKEVKSASQMYQKITVQMAVIYQQIEENNTIDIKAISKASSSMVKSVISNPNALAWLCRMSVDNQKLHQQAIRSTIWALIFARHLGLSQSDLNDLGTALLLAPIGKSKLPKELLQKNHTEQEAQQYNEHVNLTLKETKKFLPSTHQVNYILASYCERNNGTGYPRNLIGNKISFLARVAGLADYYEQLINPYSNVQESLTPAEAISHLYGQRGNLFQEELVQEFIQAIGIYPTGSLVQLNNNSVGVVLEQPEKTRLRPSIAIIKDTTNTKLAKPEILDLAKLSADVPNAIHINKSLRSTSDDLDTKNLHQTLFGNSSWF